MEPIIIDGKKISTEIKDECKEKVAKYKNFQKENKINFTSLKNGYKRKKQQSKPLLKNST